MDLDDDDGSQIETTLSKQVFHDHRDIIENYETLKTIYKNKLKKITKFEIPSIIGFRAVQIANGSPVLVEVPKHMTNTLEIAEYEFKKGKTPFILKKRIGEEFEYWKLDDLSSPLM
jgi:DNA-directed RNA polymerase subunit K/omega